MNGKTIYQPTDFFRAFPDPKDVFANQVDEHSTYLLPVATLSLRHLSNDWDGDIHFIIPIEANLAFGEPGENTEGHHNYLCRPNWIAYRLDGNKCELACDFRYFYKAYYTDKMPKSDWEKRVLAELPQCYSETQQALQEHAQFFEKHGWLCQDPDEWTGDEDDKEWMRASLAQDIGGVSIEGNWTSGTAFPVSRYPDRIEDEEDGTILECDRVLPRAEDGRDFHFIGEVEMWNYLGSSNGIMMLFFDPQEYIALTTFEWT